MFRHDIIQAIINFNFDEQLDQTILENLREDDYERIFSDGDYHPESKRKAYIKPHGTVSHPSTMRFSKVDYTAVPGGIQQAIREQLSGKVAFLVAGFGMQSVELNDLITQRMEETKNDPKPFEPTFYIINPNPETVGLPSDVPPCSKKPLHWHKPRFKTKYDIGGDLPAQLYNRIRNRLRSMQVDALPSLNQQKALTTLFTNLAMDARAASSADKNNPCDIDNELPTIFYLQTVVELVCRVAIDNGSINLESLRETKMGHLYANYVESVNKQNAHQSLNQQPIVTELRSLTDLCNDLGMIQNTTNREQFRIKKSDLQDVTGKSTPNQIARRLIERLPDALQNHGQPHPLAQPIIDEFINRWYGGANTQLEKALQEYIKEPSKEIYHVPQTEPSLTYPRGKRYATEVENWEDLAMQTSDIMSGSWDELWLISTKGNWLLDEYGTSIVKKAIIDPLKIRLVTRSSFYASTIENEFKKFIKKAKLLPHEQQAVQKNLVIDARTISPAEHNHMLSCWVKKDPALGEQAIATVYSRRTDEHAYISPVVIDPGPHFSQADTQEAREHMKYHLGLFKAYWASVADEETTSRNNFTDDDAGWDSIETQIEKVWQKIKDD